MNPAQPNELYFQKVDQVVELARQNGLYLVIMPLGGSSGSYLKQKQIITPDNARVFGRWLGQRYKDISNIIWANGADLVPWEYEAISQELATGLIEGDGNSHLITFHPGGKPGVSSSYFQKEKWLSANFIQTWSDYWEIYPLVSADFQRHPVKPVVMAEGAYEAGEEYPTRPITPFIVRKQAYWSYLGGGFHSYGHNDMWRKKPAWRESLNAPGVGQMSILKELLTSRAWWKLIPDQKLFVSGQGSGKTLNVAARSSDGDLIIVYLSSPVEVTINLNNITSGLSAHAEWVDPRSGLRSSIGQFPTTGPQTFTPPETYEDALLLLDGASKT